LIKIADWIARFYADAGLDTVFMVTGGGAMHLNDAFAREKRLKIIYCHHEQAAAIAAESYARKNGKPAILNVTSGPGGLNALTGIHGAFTDSIPVIVISGQVKKETIASLAAPKLRQLGDQEAPITEIVKPIVKESKLIDQVSKVVPLIENSVAIATGGRPGPVWYDVPLDIQSAVGSLPRKDATLIEEADYPKASNAEINEFLTMLNASERPIIFLGNGARVSNCLDVLSQFISATKLPILTGWNAHDIIPNSHPLYVGRPGTVGDRAGNINLQRADLVIVLGSRLNIRQISYNYENFAKNAKIIMVDIDKEELQKPTLKIDLPVHSDLGSFLREILSRKQGIEKLEKKKKFLDSCRKIQKELADYDSYSSEAGQINPYNFLRDVTDAAKPGTTFVCGNGAACVMTFQVANIKDGTRLYTNSGCASMGYDLPAAIGAAINGDKVVCFAGDGSLMMNIQELQTLKTQNCDVKLFIINNGGYLSIKQTQNNFFNDNLHGTAADNGVEFPNFMAVGKAFGLKCTRIAEHYSIELIKSILERTGPELIEVVVDPDQFFAPKLSARILDDGSMMSPSLEDMSPFMEQQKLIGYMKS
jgi:acetolactate synthase-1/2/3 large subunit